MYLMGETYNAVQFSLLDRGAEDSGWACGWTQIEARKRDWHQGKKTDKVAGWREIRKGNERNKKRNLKNLCYGFLWHK